MTEALDYIALHAKSRNLDVRPRTVFVEGNTDVDLFALAAKLEKKRTGIDLLGDNLAVVAAGEGDRGGVRGVCRELVIFRDIATGLLLPNGRPKYRFIGLLDYDSAGRRAIQDVRRTDTSMLEFKDVFYLRPVMPHSPNRDPSALKKAFEQANSQYRDLDWEVEDLLPKSLIEAFVSEFPFALRNTDNREGKAHYDWTRDGKPQLHRFVKLHAMYEDMSEVINVLKALWYYLGIRRPDGL